MTTSTAAKSAAAKAAKASKVADEVTDMVADAAKAHLQSASRRVQKFPRSTQQAYEGQHDRPLGGYLVAVAAYAGLTAGAAGSGGYEGHRCPPASTAATSFSSASRRIA
jgi:hypothetical protein